MTNFPLTFKMFCRAQAMLKNVQHMTGRIPKEAFIMLEKIGEGAFGNVHKGALFQGGVNTLVAIKELKVRYLCVSRACLISLTYIFALDFLMMR